MKKKILFLLPICSLLGLTSCGETIEKASKEQIESVISATKNYNELTNVDYIKCDIKMEATNGTANNMKLDETFTFAKNLSNYSISANMETVISGSGTTSSRSITTKIVALQDENVMYTYLKTNLFGQMETKTKGAYVPISGSNTGVGGVVEADTLLDIGNSVYLAVDAFCKEFSDCKFESITSGDNVSYRLTYENMFFQFDTFKSGDSYYFSGYSTENTVEENGLTSVMKMNVHYSSTDASSVSAPSDADTYTHIG